jgi:hypothetical protein
LAVAPTCDAMVTAHKDGGVSIWPLPSPPMAAFRDGAAVEGLIRSAAGLPAISSYSGDPNHHHGPGLRSMDSVDGGGAASEISITATAVTALTNTTLLSGRAGLLQFGGAHGGGAAHRLSALASGPVPELSPAPDRGMSWSLPTPHMQQPKSTVVAPDVPAWRVKTWCMQAHASAVVALSVAGPCVVTASSAGGVKVSSGDDLAALLFCGCRARRRSLWC